MAAQIAAAGTEFYVEQHGDRPVVLLIAGLGDPAEASELRLEGLSDRYRRIAFENRSAGRKPLPDGSLLWREVDATG